MKKYNFFFSLLISGWLVFCLGNIFKNANEYYTVSAIILVYLRVLILEFKTNK